jgi:hypothetical protein
MICPWIERWFVEVAGCGNRVANETKKEQKTIMNTETRESVKPAAVDAAPRASRKVYWIGWVMSVLPCLMLLFSAAMKLAQPPEVIEGFKKLGWPENLAVPLGILELACTVIYLVPKTAVLGAILLTGYLGGAMATHIRLGDPFIMHIVFGVVIWGGIFLRDARLRELIPFRK